VQDCGVRPGVFLTVAVAALALLSDQAHAQTAPTVTSKLPAWRAPGAPLGVRGTAAPGAAVELWIGARRRAETVAGGNGGFAFRVRVPDPRRTYEVAVVSGGERTVAGELRVRPVRLAAGGDVTLGNGVRTAIARHGPRWPWLSVAPVLRAADIAVVNLETCVSTRGRPWPGKEFTFRGTPVSLRVTRRFAGVDVGSLANNHSLDYGRTAFADTLRYARRYGLRTIGGGADLARARRPAILTRGGLRVAFLGFSDVRPPGFDAGPSRSGATPAFPAYIRKDVRRAKRNADVVVVYFHWGIELDRSPTARQRLLARIALHAGASVVLGAHPHVLQPRERRGNRLIAWSLGNFVFDWNSPGTDRTGILRFGLGARGVVWSSFRRARINWVQPRLRRERSSR
jgi:poly-gamma-glutamate capsule biosynthesis protein CapA/YwtB (metallophosphatase superfamily)